jgi:hypothetical protein
LIDGPTLPEAGPTVMQVKLITDHEAASVQITLEAVIWK